jgi:hypothetical protein
VVLGIGDGLGLQPTPSARGLAVGTDDQPGLVLRRTGVADDRHGGTPPVSRAIIDPDHLGRSQHGRALRPGPSQQHLLQLGVGEPDRGQPVDRDRRPGQRVHALSVLVEADLGQRHDADLLERLAEAGPQGLGMPPRPAQLSPDAIPEPALLLDHQHTQTETCQHAPE